MWRAKQVRRAPSEAYQNTNHPPVQHIEADLITLVSWPCYLSMLFSQWEGDLQKTVLINVWVSHAHIPSVLGARSVLGKHISGTAGLGGRTGVEEVPDGCGKGEGGGATRYWLAEFPQLCPFEGKSSPEEAPLVPGPASPPIRPECLIGVAAEQKRALPLLQPQ